MISLCLEVFRFAVTWCYSACFGYPLIQYLEYPTLLLQQCCLVYFVLKYSNQLNRSTLWIAALLFISIALFLTDVLPRFLLIVLIVSRYQGVCRKCTYHRSELIHYVRSCSQPLCAPIGGFSKIIQLVKLFKTKDSTAVSTTTWLLSTLTALSK